MDDAVIKALVERATATESAVYRLQVRLDALEEANAKSPRFKKPTVTELWQYSQKIGFPEFDPDKFLAHYDSNGWMVGKTHMKDWQAAVRTWHRFEKERQRQAGIR